METEELTRALEQAAGRLPPAPADSRAAVARRVRRQRHQRAAAALAVAVVMSAGVGVALVGHHSTAPRTVVAAVGPPSGALRTYADTSVGFSLRYPSGWRATPFAHQCMIEATGVVIANVAQPMTFQPLGPNACTTNFDTRNLPSNLVFVTFDAGVRFSGVHPDTALPVSLGPTQPGPEGGMTTAGATVYHAGGADSIWVTYGPTASAADRLRADQIVASLAFPSGAEASQLCTAADLARPVPIMPNPVVVTTPLVLVPAPNLERLSAPTSKSTISAAQAWASLVTHAFDAPRDTGSVELLLGELYAQTPSRAGQPIYAHTLVWALYGQHQPIVSLGGPVRPAGAAVTAPPCSFGSIVSYVDAVTGQPLFTETF